MERSSKCKSEDDKITEIIRDEKYDSMTSPAEELQLGSPYTKKTRYNSTISLVDLSLSDSSHEEITEAYHNHLLQRVASIAGMFCNSKNTGQIFPLKNPSSRSNLFVALQIEPPVQVDVVTETMREIRFPRQKTHFATTHKNSTGTLFFNANYKCNSFSKLFCQSRTPTRVQSAPFEGVGGEEVLLDECDQFNNNNDNNNEDPRFSHVNLLKTRSSLEGSDITEKNCLPTEEDFMVTYLNRNSRYMGTRSGDSLEECNLGVDDCGYYEEEDGFCWKQLTSDLVVDDHIHGTSVKIEEITETETENKFSDHKQVEVEHTDSENVIALHAAEAKIHIPFKPTGPVTFVLKPTDWDLSPEDVTKSKSMTFVETILERFGSNEIVNEVHDENENTLYECTSEHELQLQLFQITEHKNEELSNNEFEVIFRNKNFEMDICEEVVEPAKPESVTPSKVEPVAYLINTSSSTMEEQIQFITNLDYRTRNTVMNGFMPFINVMDHLDLEQQTKVIPDLTLDENNVSQKSYIVEWKSEDDDDADQEHKVFSISKTNDVDDCGNKTDKPDTSKPAAKVLTIETDMGKFTFDEELLFLKSPVTISSKAISSNEEWRTPSIIKVDSSDGNGNMADRKVLKALRRKVVHDSSGSFHQSIISNLIALTNAIKEKASRPKPKVNEGEEMEEVKVKTIMKDVPEDGFKIAASSSRFRGFIQALNQRLKKIKSSFSFTCSTKICGSRNSSGSTLQEDDPFSKFLKSEVSLASNKSRQTKKYQKIQIRGHDRVQVPNCRKREAFIRHVFIKRSSFQSIGRAAVVGGPNSESEVKPSSRKRYTKRLVPLENFTTTSKDRKTGRKRCADTRVILVRF